MKALHEARQARDACEEPETLRLAGWLQDQAAAEPPPNLPTSSQIWWRAQILRRLSEPDPSTVRATRPVLWTTAIGVIIAFVTVLLALIQGFAKAPSATTGAYDPALLWICLAASAIGFPIVACSVLVILARDEGLLH